MRVDEIINFCLDTDPDLLFRTAAANYTLSAAQIAAVMSQIYDQKEVGHLLTYRCLKDLDIDPESCRKFVVPLVGDEKPVYLYDISPDRDLEIFPRYKSIILSMRQSSGFEKLLAAFSKSTKLTVMQGRMESENGKKVFMIGEKVCLSPDAEISDVVTGLMLLALDILTTRAENKTAGIIGKKLFSILAETYDMIDLDPLYKLSIREQYEAFQNGLIMVRQLMSWIFPTLTLNAVIELQKFYQEDMLSEELLDEIQKFDEDTFEYLEACGVGKVQMLLKYVEVGRMRYTPPIKI